MLASGSLVLQHKPVISTPVVSSGSVVVGGSVAVNVTVLNSAPVNSADLSLTFAITDDSLGGQAEVELFPG